MNKILGLGKILLITILIFLGMFSFGASIIIPELSIFKRMLFGSVSLICLILTTLYFLLLENSKFMIDNQKNLNTRILMDLNSVSKNYNKLLKRKMGFGQGDLFSKDIEIMSMLREGIVEEPSLKVIEEFLKEIKHSDTLFLIRIDHYNGLWWLRVCGQSITLNQALAVMELISNRIILMSDIDGSLIEKKEIILN